MISDILLSLILTVAIEFLVYTLLVKKDAIKLLFYSFVINLFTVPLANIFIGFYGLQSLFIVELIVFLVEAPLIIILLKLKPLKAFILSLIANLVSTAVGFFLFFH